uniref:MBOAT family protein n=1 Tax=Angiostrongylus cantonensis TaxID=6313 RepID=A0A0K0DNT6_ANGCA
LNAWRIPQGLINAESFIKMSNVALLHFISPTLRILMFVQLKFFCLGMRPPPPPICIARVSRYSLMWRHFDAGLYQFLKNQVYIPLMKIPLPLSLAIVRIFGTLAAVFGVVLAWHGFKTNYICWVSLSALELIIERVGKLIWNTARFQDFRQRIGETNTRRVVAVAMLATVIPGIFGVFFFLGEQGIGSVVDSAGFVLLHLLILGYFFNHVCLDFETKYEHKKSGQE